jgi:hypothetical protein
MHIFKCIVDQTENLTPSDSSKLKLWNKLIDHYRRSEEIITVTLEVKSKVINSNQEGLYRAFIIKAADHFGNDFSEMQPMLMQFWPLDMLNSRIPKTPDRWTADDLNSFIDRATAHLAPFGFHF